MFIKFQYDEILVTANEAVLIGGERFPNSGRKWDGLVGSPQADLKTAIETAGNLSQIRVLIKLSALCLDQCLNQYHFLIMDTNVLHQLIVVRS